MDRVRAFNRKSSALALDHPPSDSSRRPSANDHRPSFDLPRPSVSWTVKEKDEHKADGEKTEEKKDKNDALGKEIGLLYGGSLVMNAIIGPGIFGTPKGVLAGVNSVGMSLIMWTFSGMFSMCAALCFAELRESVKREGVEYAYITEAFGPLAGHVYSWMRIAAAEPIATAVFAMAFTDYVADAVHDDCGPPQLFTIILATFTILTMFLINLLSTKLSEKLQMLASVGKICALSVVIIMGIARMVEGKTDIIERGFMDTKWDPSDLAFACYNGLWAYGGWSNVNHVTSGIKKPPRNVPRVVKTIIPLVLILYLLTVLSYFTAMTPEELLHSRAIGVTWAERVLGPAASIIYIGVGLTALGSLNATFLSAGRLSGVAAKNGQMPDVASWVHVRSKTPIITVALRCMIAVVAVCVADGQELLRFYIFIVWLFHGTSIVALLILRFKNKKKKRPYKVDLWIPILVVLGIAYLLLAPFLENPEKEFIAALVLLGVSLLSYYPIIWFKAHSKFEVPDNITIWLQLFLRVAPKRDLRRERRSMMRRMSMFARDSILITPSVMPSPDMMRRFSRRMSRFNRLDGSPALLRRLGEDQGQTHLRRRMHRGNSLAEADIIRTQRGRSNSMWAFGSDSKPSPAIIRKKPNRQSRSFNQADVKLKSPPSLPILKNRFNTTPEATEDSMPGALAPPNGTLMAPHQTLRPKPSPIPEEDSSNYRPSDSNAEDNKSQTSQQNDDSMQVVADFESDGGGEYEVLAHPQDVRRLSYDVCMNSDSNDDSSSSDSSSSKSNKSNDLRHSIFASLFAPTSTSSSDSDSSMDEDGSLSDEEGLPPLPSFYYSDDEIASETSDEGGEDEEAGGYVNHGAVVFKIEDDEQEQEQNDQDGQPNHVDGENKEEEEGKEDDGLPNGHDPPFTEV